MSARPTGTRELRVPVIGMTCEGCASLVRRGLSGLDGVVTVEVDEAAGIATVVGDVDPTQVRERIEELGYTADTEVAAPTGTSRPGVLVAVVVFVVLGGAAGFVVVADLVTGADAVVDLQATIAEVSPFAFLVSFLLGIAVAFSAATLAMAPAVMGSVVAGHSHARRRSVSIAAAFVAGMLVVDVAIGALFAAAGQPAIDWLEGRLAIWFAAMFVVLAGMALVVSGRWKPRLPSFLPDVAEVNDVGGAFAAGVPFGLLACPSCTPLLLPVILGAVATGDPLYGAAILGVFGLGRGLPLIAIGASAGLARRARAMRRHVHLVEQVVAVLLGLGALYFLFAFVLTVVDRGPW